MEKIIKEVRQTELHSNNINREDGGFSSLSFTLKDWKKVLCRTRHILPLDSTILCDGPEMDHFLFTVPIGLDWAPVPIPWL
jgi:hypothetical protein